MYGFICVVVFLDCFVVWIYRYSINVCWKTIKNVQFTCRFRESRGLLLPQQHQRSKKQSNQQQNEHKITERETHQNNNQSEQNIYKTNQEQKDNNITTTNKTILQTQPTHAQKNHQTAKQTLKQIGTNPSTFTTGKYR